jgi:excisionase family DNA binding protein
MSNPFETIDARLSNIENLLLDLKQTSKSTANQPDPEQLLTIKQAAEMLCLSVPTIYGFVHDASIPVSKKGKRLYFSRQELTDWVKSGRKKTVSEIEAEAETSLANHKKKK